MSDLRKLAEQAMGYLADYTVGESPNASAVNDLIADLDAALAQPESEPVAWRYDYTRLPQRKPLTDEKIDELSRTMVKGDRSVNWLCRAIERAHEIGGEK